MKPFSFNISDIFAKEQNELWLWIPVLFGFGAVFFISFEAGFSRNFSAFLILFFAVVAFWYFSKEALRSLLFLAVAVFLSGSFYAFIYQKTFLNHTKITGKIYVDGIAKIESVREFYNPTIHRGGAVILLSDPILYKAEFNKSGAKNIKIKKHKKTKIKKKNPEKVKRKTKKQKAEELGLSIAEYEQMRALEKEKKLEERIKKAEIKEQKKRQREQKYFMKNFINIANYQDVDRKFLDYAKNYQNVKWVKDGDKDLFLKPPQKLLVNAVKNYSNLKVNDLVALRMMLQPPDKKEFFDDFDFSIDAKARKIGAYGFAMGSVKVLRESEISNLEQWFLDLREEIRGKIYAVMKGDDAAIAVALLIGDQNQISKEMMNNIRISGLAHLLSISGFHLSLAAMIFLFLTRFLLSRSEYLSLHFDLKKVAAVIGIFSSYFYLKISGSPPPAERAFLMVLFGLISLLISQKVNAKRMVMSAVLLMILYNPYGMFNIGLQLSFAAIIVLGALSDDVFSKFKPDRDRNFVIKASWYFLEIILVSIILQIALMPFLMHSFQNVALLGFIANILAIPLASFWVMPFGFLALFMMPFGLEKLPLIAMKEGIIWTEKIMVFVANLDYVNWISPELSGFGLSLAIFGLLLLCLAKTKIRFLGLLFFVLSFAEISIAKKPDLAFNKDQKFFTIYDQENGLIFSKDMKPSKRRELWMKKFNQKDFKSFNDFSKEWQEQKGIFCDLDKCVIYKNQKFLVLFSRGKINEICQNDFDVIINLSARYQLPDCIKPEKIKIDNLDFHQNGGQFFYFENGNMSLKTGF